MLACLRWRSRRSSAPRGRAGEVAAAAAAPARACETGARRTAEDAQRVLKGRGEEVAHALDGHVLVRVRVECLDLRGGEAGGVAEAATAAAPPGSVRASCASRRHHRSPCRSAASAKSASGRSTRAAREEERAAERGRGGWVRGALLFPAQPPLRTPKHAPRAAPGGAPARSVVAQAQEPLGCCSPSHTAAPTVWLALITQQPRALSASPAASARRRRRGAGHARPLSLSLASRRTPPA